MISAYPQHFESADQIDDLPPDDATSYYLDDSITCFPDLTRFTHLQILYCSYCNLTSIPTLPQTLRSLYCDNNALSCLPTLPETLIHLFCNDNNITRLPTLTENIHSLFCNNNELNWLPTLPENLKELSCCNNKLTWLPTLPETLEELSCCNNNFIPIPNLPGYIQKLLYGVDPIIKTIHYGNLKMVKKIIKILNRARYLSSSLKLKNWVWEKVIQPKMMKRYHPSYLQQYLDEDVDLEIVLYNW